MFQRTRTAAAKNHSHTHTSRMVDYRTQLVVMIWFQPNCKRENSILNKTNGSFSSAPHKHTRKAQAWQNFDQRLPNNSNQLQIKHWSIIPDHAGGGEKAFHFPSIHRQRMEFLPAKGPPARPCGNAIRCQKAWCEHKSGNLRSCSREWFSTLEVPRPFFLVQLLRAVYITLFLARPPFRTPGIEKDASAMADGKMAHGSGM